MKKFLLFSLAAMLIAVTGWAIASNASGFDAAGTDAQAETMDDLIKRLPLTGGSGEGSEMSIEVLETDADGNPLSATYTITNGTWGDNASHLSLFKHSLTPEAIADYDKAVIEFAEPVPASTGSPTYGFIPVGFICPAGVGGDNNFQCVANVDKFEIVFSEAQKEKGIGDFSLFFNASGDLKDVSLTIKSVYLAKEGAQDVDPTPAGPALPELSTPEAPKYYRIKSVATGEYAVAPNKEGQSSDMTMTSDPNEASKFFFVDAEKEVKTFSTFGDIKTLPGVLICDESGRSMHAIDIWKSWTKKSELSRVWFMYPLKKDNGKEGFLLHFEENGNTKDRALAVNTGVTPNTIKYTSGSGQLGLATDADEALFVFEEAVPVKPALPEVSTPEAPKYYTIKSVATGEYAVFTGDFLTMTSDVKKASPFYVVDAGKKIASYTDGPETDGYYICNDKNCWYKAGEWLPYGDSQIKPWFILPETIDGKDGFILHYSDASKKRLVAVDTRKSPNRIDYTGADYWSGQSWGDVETLFVFEDYVEYPDDPSTPDDPVVNPTTPVLPTCSTTDAPKYYFIKSVATGEYAVKGESGNMTVTTDRDAASKFFFVDMKKDVKTFANPPADADGNTHATLPGVLICNEAGQRLNAIDTWKDWTGIDDASITRVWFLYPYAIDGKAGFLVHFDETGKDSKDRALAIDLRGGDYAREIRYTGGNGQTGYPLTCAEALFVFEEVDPELVDLTYMLTNPNFNDGTTGWTINEGKIEVKQPNSGNPVVSAYDYTLDVCQTVTGLTPGEYIVKVQACSRHMMGAAGIKDYETKKAAGQEVPNEAYLYANNDQVKVKYIYDETSTYDFAKEAGRDASELTMSNGQQIPYNTQNFVVAFNAGMYENELKCIVGSDGTLTIGIKNQLKHDDANSIIPYLAYDNFRLYKLGAGGEQGPEIEPEYDLFDLKTPAGEFAAICMPYAVRTEYFGQVYMIAGINDGKATIVPVKTVSAGTPCVVLSTGEANIDSASIKVSTGQPKTQISYWDNHELRGSYTTRTWTAVAVDGTEYKAKDLEYVIADLANMNFTATIENNAAARFWYDNPDYSTSSPTVVHKYMNMPIQSMVSGLRADQPNPVIIPLVQSSSKQTLTYSIHPDFSDAKTVSIGANALRWNLFNLLPGMTYYYKTDNGLSAGQFTVTGALRMIYVKEGSTDKTRVANMRDLGGKKTVDGKYVKYGKIYRNAEFRGGNTCIISDAQLKEILAMNIGAEIDLRNDDGGKSFLPNAVRNDNYYWAQRESGDPTYIGNGPSTLHNKAVIKNLKAEFEFIVKNLRKDVAVDFHCRIGADRTGMLAFLLNGLLGVSEADLLRDYETTSFAPEPGLRTKKDGDGQGGDYDSNMPKEFNDKIPAGGTLRDAFERYFLEDLGVEKDLIDEYRSIMLGETPIDDYLTSVSLTEVDNANTVTGTYDLSGRKINSSNLTPGLYIVNGKKMLVK